MSVKVSNKIPRSRVLIRRAASQLVRKTLLKIETGAKLRAPVRTGFLRNSIGSEMEGDLAGAATVGAEYGAAVNFGTRHKEPDPFFDEAWEEGKQTFEAGMKEILK